MRIAYLTNLYPNVSHGFIRREFFALEREGFEVARYASRGSDTDLVYPDDITEQARTRRTLRNDLGPLLGALFETAFAHPRAFGRGAKLAWVLKKTRAAATSLSLNLLRLCVSGSRRPLRPGGQRLCRTFADMPRTPTFLLVGRLSAVRPFWCSPVSPKASPS